MIQISILIFLIFPFYNFLYNKIAKNNEIDMIKKHIN